MPEQTDYYQIETYTASLQLPQRHQLLDVVEHENQILLLVREDPESPTVVRRFFLVGKNQELLASVPVEYVGTVVIRQGDTPHFHYHMRLLVFAEVLVYT